MIYCTIVPLYYCTIIVPLYPGKLWQINVDKDKTNYEVVTGLDFRSASFIWPLPDTLHITGEALVASTRGVSN